MLLCVVLYCTSFLLFSFLREGAIDRLIRLYKDVIPSTGVCCTCTVHIYTIHASTCTVHTCIYTIHASTCTVHIYITHVHAKYIHSTYIHVHVHLINIIVHVYNRDI